MTEAISKWRGEDLVAAMLERRVPAHVALTTEEWRATEQGVLLARRPLIELKRIGDADPVPLPRGPRPNSGIRALDLAHVIAGPICATQALFLQVSRIRTSQRLAVRLFG